MSKRHGDLRLSSVFHSIIEDGRKRPLFTQHHFTPEIRVCHFGASALETQPCISAVLNAAVPGCKHKNSIFSRIYC